MATQVGSGYDQYVGTRASSANPQVTEFYNKQTGAGFSDPNQLSGFVNQQFGATTNAQNVFSTLQGTYTPPTVPVNLTPSTTTTSNTLATPPKTQFDIQSLIAENQKLQQQYMQAFSTPDPQIQQKQQDLNNLQNQARSTQLNAQAGLNAIADKPIAMPFITGQQASVQRQANLALQTNAFQQQPLVQQLEILSGNRHQMLKAYELALSFGKEDIGLAIQLQQMQKQEQQAAKQMALEYGVGQPYYEVGGTVYRTGDGKAYSTPEEFLADGGNWGQIQKIEPGQQEERAMVMDLASKYVDAGITVSDSLAVAQQKVQKSRIYQEQIRPPGNTGVQKSELKAIAVSAATEKLQESRGKDGYTDPGVYMKLRSDYVGASLGSASDFDSTFSPYLSSKERERLLKTYKSDGTDGELSPELKALLGL